MAEASLSNLKYDYEEVITITRQALLGCGGFEIAFIFFAWARIGFFEWLILTLIAILSLVIAYIRYSKKLDGRYDLRVLLGKSKDGKQVKNLQEAADFGGMLFGPLVSGLMLLVFNHLENILFDISSGLHMFAAASGLAIEFYEVFVLNN